MGGGVLYLMASVFIQSSRYLLIATSYRMIGYDDAACADTTSYFGRANASVPFWMDNIQCTGSEEVLDDCSFSGWGIHSCSHSINDAGIVCVNSELYLFMDKLLS